MCFRLRLGDFSLMPLIITDSFYSKNIINYNFFLKHVSRKKNRGVQAENFASSQLQGPFLLVRQGETNDMRLLYVHVRFCKFQVVSQSCNMLQLIVELCSIVFPVCRYVLNIISVQILDKCDETSLTVIRIAVSLTVKFLEPVRIWYG